MAEGNVNVSLALNMPAPCLITSKRDPEHIPDNGWKAHSTHDDTSTEVRLETPHQI